MKPNQPERVLRLGFLTVSVFVNSFTDSDGNEREFRSITLQKRYRVNGESKFSSNFGVPDIPLAIQLLQRAFDHVAETEIERPSGHSEENVFCKKGDVQ